MSLSSIWPWEHSLGCLVNNWSEKWGSPFLEERLFLPSALRDKDPSFQPQRLQPALLTFPWKVWLQNFCCYSTVCHWAPRVHSHAPLKTEQNSRGEAFLADWSHSAEFQTHCVAGCALDLAHVSKGGQEKLFCSIHPCFKCQYLLQTSSITRYCFSVVIVTLHITTLY